MRAILIMFLLVTIKVNATTYYVSNSGEDSHDGLAENKAWQTLAKVNGFTFASGDSILLKCGDTWTERLLPKSNVHFASYSTGERPIITGFTAASFGAASVNIYTQSVTLSNNIAVVKVNGNLAGKARYPNSGYLTFSSYSGDSIINTSLTGTPDYTGKEIVIRTTPWGVNIATVQTQSTGQIKVTPKLFTTPSYSTNGYFFQNDETFLDSATEWSYNAGTFKVYATSSPTVYYANIDTLVYCSNKTNISFNNINFSGANTTLFNLDTCTYISITNCNLSESSSAITGYKTTHTTLTNDTVRNMLQYGVALSGTAALTNPSSYTTVSNTYFRNIGNIIGTVNAIWRGTNGSATNYWQTPHALFTHGHYNSIQYNYFDSCGYIPIFFTGDSTQVKYNSIDTYCYNFDDGGAIYTKLGFSSPDYQTSANSNISYNIIRNGYRNNTGVVTGGGFVGYAHGVYIDDNFLGPVTVDSNLVFNTTGKALNMRTSRIVIVRHNTFIDSLSEIYAFTGNQFQTYQLNFKNNTYWQKNSSVYISNTGSLAAYTYESDSNIIIRPTAPSGLLRYNSVDYSLSGYQAATTYEDNSTGSLPALTSSTTGTLFYNDTQETATEHVSTSYVDIYGNKYFGYFDLQPFAWVILFPVSNISFSKTYIVQ